MEEPFTILEIQEYITRLEKLKSSLAPDSPAARAAEHSIQLAKALLEPE